jgi:ATP-binding cassette subfamily B (MDR/TAP) protein 1
MDVFLLTLAMVCAAGSGVVIPLTSLVLGNLLNSTSEGTAFASLVDTMSLYMTLLSIGAFLFLGGGVALFFVASQRQAQRLRMAYFKSLLAQEVSYSDTHSMAQAATRLTEQTVNFQAGIGEKLFLIISGACQFLGSLALAFSVAASAWRLALTLMAALPAAVGAVALLFTFLQRLSGESDDSYARAGEIASESLTMVRTVAALGAEEHEAGKYEKHLAAAEKVGRSRGLISGFGQGIFMFTMSALYASELVI